MIRKRKKLLATILGSAGLLLFSLFPFTVNGQESTEVKVVSYNIKHWLGHGGAGSGSASGPYMEKDWVPDMSIVANGLAFYDFWENVLNSLDADVICLQENSNGPNTGSGFGIDDHSPEIMAELAERLGMYYFCPNKGRWHWLGAFSKFPITYSHYYDESEMPSGDDGLLRIDVDLGGGTLLTLYDFHLHYENTTTRYNEITEIFNIADDEQAYPHIFTCDFNASANSNEAQRFKDKGYAQHGEGVDFIWIPTDGSVELIDDIGRVENQWTSTGQGDIVGSDHLPVKAIICIDRPTGQ